MEDRFITPLQPLRSIMDVSGISGLRTVNGQTQVTGSDEIKGQEGISAFKSIFEEAIDNVRSTEDTLTKRQYQLATGQIEDPHTVGIASSEAQLAVDMLVALRTKAFEAYNEIMRISL
ncbi:MAG: flagellar hook-basal body complex protein FliE [Dorea sp.]|jgi:flagellar hook-basal body complex protein FliE|nr:flagellar hook-basal body complex protein FliE [Dorea sp.]MCI9455085.1 flagellar hook-basal body complex protein FliE [Dorea sp.]